MSEVRDDIWMLSPSIRRACRRDEQADPVSQHKRNNDVTVMRLRCWLKDHCLGSATGIKNRRTYRPSTQEQTT